MGPVAIDCDPGVDDAIALLWAMASPLDLRAVTVVAGNVPLAVTAANARRIVTLAGRTDVPVHAGCPRPLVERLETAAHVHGESGLDGAELPQAEIALAEDHAVDRLIALAHAHDQLTVCAVGPLTNVAMALVKDPAIAPKLARIVLMGGAVGGGNVTPSAEFNFYVDPHAAKVVFASGVPLVMLGLDVTEQVRPTPPRLDRLGAVDNAAGRAVAGMLRPYAARAADGGALHDPLAVAYLLAPELFEGRDAVVEIVAEGTCRGRSVVDVRGRSPHPPNARVVERVDADAVFERLCAALERLP
ncbi:MAG: nucleoside hydrolase [Alphaproteobacteria bacterium]|jgi:purine nucleosidase|nr:nucleoside hydrolase [Alphaproteobacteria bacterium]